MQRRGAFTLVELLVVIAIIGVLVALLLPAVQAAREAGRRMQCQNNLKQIGIATHNYHDLRRVLPPGGIVQFATYPLPPIYAKGSTTVHILPFLEQEQIYLMYDFDQPIIDAQVVPGTTKQIRSIKIPTYRCPSDNDRAQSATVARNNYLASAGATNLSGTGNWQTPCQCNNSFTAYGLPATGSNQVSGVFQRGGLCIGLHEVTDGLSNTIFFGEGLPHCSAHARNGWGNTNNGCGLASTTIPINYDSCDPSSPVGGSGNCGRPCTWVTELGFKSRHRGGSQFLLGDGAVVFISEYIDHQMFQYLGAKADGNPVAY